MSVKLTGVEKNIEESFFSEDFRKEKIFPDWVTPCMIFPLENLTLESQLGHGNYGVVFKGKWKQGTAV